MAAKRPRTVTIRRNEENHDILFYGSPAPMTRGALHAALEGHVRAWIRAACIWRELAIGDHRFLSFSIEIAPGVHVFVQFRSEPAEPLRWEVSSGRSHPPTGEWLAGERAARIEALGFAIGGEAQNYQREVEVSTPAEVAALAREVVTILYDAFEYRGTQPIAVRLLHEGRAELKATFAAFTPQDVSKVFAGLGFTVEEPDGEDQVTAPPVIRCRKRGTETLVYFWDQVAGEHLYARVRFEADMELPEEERQLLKDAAEAPEDGDPYTTVSVVHAFSGGVTLEWLIARIGEWDAMLREGRRAVRKGRSRRPTTLPAGPTIH